MRDAWWGPPWALELRGRWVADTVHGAALAGNPLGDPVDRPLYVWLPPGYDDDPGRRWPVVAFLHGFAGQADSWENRRAFQPTLLERIDAAAPPAIVALPDGWTSWGGAQWLDSPAVGAYQTYLSVDVVAHLDGTYRTVADRTGRAVAGHSSGGYGAVLSALRHPEVWGRWASHAGDGLFEVCFLPEIRVITRTLQRRYGGSWDAFWAEVAERGPLSRDDDFPLLNAWAMAACFAGGRLPCDPAGRLDLEAWAAWLACDPVRLVAQPSSAAAVASWLGAWIDAGTGDEVYLDLAATALADAVRATGLPAARVRFELHDGRHGGQDARFPLSICWLAEQMAERT
ncbi:MAG: alpha/beta hydrolase-fold protein [Acidimicrobiales bacterium]